MTLKQAKEHEWSGVRVVIDAGTPYAKHARLWGADAKWTDDMIGMATVQIVDEHGSPRASGHSSNGHTIIERRRLKLLSEVISERAV